MSALFETMLLCVHLSLAKRTAASVSPLSGNVACERIGELSMVRGGGLAGRISSTDLFECQGQQFVAE